MGIDPVQNRTYLVCQGYSFGSNLNRPKHCIYTETLLPELTLPRAMVRSICQPGIVNLYRIKLTEP